MTNSNEKKLLIKIAHMYYEQDMTQSQISKELGIYRTTISRMLKKSREEGIVKIIINYDAGNNEAIENELKKRFDLKEAIVVPIDSDQPKHLRLNAIGQACASLLERINREDDMIGFSWGSSLAAVVEALRLQDKKQNILCVPLIGGPAGKLDTQYHVNTICYQASLKLNGKSLMIDVPAVMEQKEIRDAIMESNYFKMFADVWKNISIAVFGIGSLEISETSTWLNFYGRETTRKLKKSHVTGDICSQFFDINGKRIQTSISDRTIAMDLNQIKKVRYSIGVAESPEKVSGIIGALNGRYMNTLVTTEETAREILNQTEDK
ncbi:sugar-binding transcriptional regulator [Terrilactibacillus laevilacticus]|uniref:Sugar-binding transcriptional regulator n=1 Tax=Terrilactibacillus laevilacticus TaxID=1380157 RepID=A0ABW5PNK3_9BACI|nr:sugar-binding transcriptional regulator [Terrilactibacillus laevilacticus]